MRTPTPQDAGGGEPAGGDDAYLWDKSGTPDPRIVELERLLTPVRLAAGSTPGSVGAREAEGERDGSESRGARVHPASASGFGTTSQRGHHHRRFRWVLPAAGTLALFTMMAFVAWPMRPWGPGTARQEFDPPPVTDPGTSGGGLVLTDWNARPTGGTPTLGPKFLASPQQLAVNQWLRTDASSTVSLTAAAVGTVKVEPNSRLRIKTVQKGQHWLELAQGRIEAITTAPPNVFYVQTPSAIAVDMGCAYTLEVDASGAGMLHVTAGWVELQRGDRAVRVPRGNMCAIRPGAGPGTPVDEHASAFLVAAVERFDAYGASPKVAMKSSPLGDILSSVGEGKSLTRDAVTLWHVLREVELADRLAVVEKLAELVPPPAGVTQESLVHLDAEALEQWWDLIRFR